MNPIKNRDASGPEEGEVDHLRVNEVCSTHTFQRFIIKTRS